MSIRVALACSAEIESALRVSLERDGDISVTAVLRAAPRWPLDLPADVVVADTQSLGRAALEQIERVMQVAPMPILALCPPGDAEPGAIQALLSGAVDAIPRSAYLNNGGRLLRQRVHVVSGVGVIHRVTAQPPARSGPAGRRVVAMAASTGGPAALATVLGRLGRLSVPVLLVQHLHEQFMASFVDWLAGHSELPVTLAVHNGPLEAGHVYVAPAGQHLRLNPDQTPDVSPSPTETRAPSADELFNSVAKVAGPAAVGVLLTGMGADGAVGLLAMRRAGGRTIIQDEASSAVFGMPKAAHDLGAAEQVLPLTEVADAIVAAVQTVPR